VNGALPQGMGPDVDPLQDKVTLDGRLLVWSKERRYLAYHKPSGVLVSRRSQGGHPTIYDDLGKFAHGLHSVGRLDLESEGLLLLTDDGVLAEALLHPRTGLRRVYRVWVEPTPEPEAMRRLREGAVVDGVPMRPDQVVLEGAERGRGILRFELLEGKKREIRLLTRFAGLRVHQLLRVQFGPHRLEALPRGAVRPLRTSEINALRRLARIAPP
jgi:23S rRNA pseudouridine2605 synthase